MAAETMFQMGSIVQAEDEVTIYVDGRRIGTAESARVDSRRGKLTVERLDALANLFFAACLSGGEEDASIGWVVVHGADGRWIDAPAASIFSFSSGTGDLVLTSSGLRFIAEAPVANSELGP